MISVLFYLNLFHYFSSGLMRFIAEAGCCGGRWFESEIAKGLCAVVTAWNDGASKVQGVNAHRLHWTSMLLWHQSCSSSSLSRPLSFALRNQRGCFPRDDILLLIWLHNKFLS